MERLFALELLVEVLRTAEPGPAELPGPAEHPAVALRLLDFPTLVLRPAAAAPPLRPGQPFPFGRGKRCLFRWRPDSLFAALRRRPLHALLLALPAGLAPGPPRLLGSCAVSLAPAAEVLQRPGAPSYCGRFALRDTAGRPVGELVLRYRLSCLEADEARPASPRAATPPATTPEPRDEEEEKEEEKEEEEGEQLEGNVFCPPLLYYSREPAEPQRPPATVGQWVHVEPQRLQEKDKGHSPPRPSAGPSLLHPASPREPQNAPVHLPLLSALLAELSVLTRSAVPAAAVHPHLAWLYQAPGSGDTASQPPSHSAALRPAETPVGSGRSSEVPNPPFQQGCQKATSPESSAVGRRPKKAVPEGQPACERSCKAKENRPPRKKLLYGLTNTLRLRLQQTNPDKLIIHERREQYRKKQMEMLKGRSPLPKRKLVRNTEEQHVVSCRHCSTGGSSKRNNQLDKIVQTSLENSALSESVSVRGDKSPGLQKQSIASLSRNDSIITAPLPEETLLKSAHEEKFAKAQLPAAFPSDANAKGSYNDAINLIHHKIIEHDDMSVVSGHKLSPSRSVENNSEFIYSDDFVGSPENTVCSEDFTNAESTGRDSKVCDSSPEPQWLQRPKQDRSDTESSRSRMSKTSQKAQSTSDLVPVPSASSPVQSLRRNCDFKTSMGTSAESADSLNLAEMEASLLEDEKQKAQQMSNEENGEQMSKEENRGDRHILRSKQFKSDTDLNTGKGQTSTGQKQSVTQVSSYLPSNMSDLELSVLENSRSDKEDDFLEKLHGPNQYKDISELVINKLPGYTM